MTQEPATPPAVSEVPEPPLTPTAGTSETTASRVRDLAGAAALDIAGVHALGAGKTLSILTSSWAGSDGPAGVVVEVDETSCAVHLGIVVESDVNIPRVVEGVRHTVASRIKAVTGLDTREVNVWVVDMYVAPAL